MKEYNVKVDWLWYVGISLEFPNRNAVVIVNKEGRILHGFGGYKWAKKMSQKRMNVIFKEDHPDKTLKQINDIVLRQTN